MSNEIPGLLQLGVQLSEVQSLLQQIQQKLTPSVEGEHLQIQFLSDLKLQVSKLADELTLISSASGTDYTQLRNLLAAEEWKKADEETRAQMLKGSKREEKGGWLDRGEIERFPWQDLRIINRLWVKYSNGRFGFSIQKQLWLSVYVTKNNDFEIEKSLGDRVGWRVNNNWLNYEQLTFAPSAAEGHLSSTLHLVGVDKGRVEDRIRFFFSRLDLPA